MSWVETTLGKSFELYQPQTITTKDLIVDGEYQVYGANGVIGRYDKYNHEEPQLLVTCRGATCGAVNVSSPFSWINGNAMVIKPKSNDIDVKFVEYFFRGAVDLTKAITGAAQPQITRQSLSPISFKYPVLDIQKKIVAKLDAIFAEIDKAKAAAEANAKNAEALFQSYLNQVFESDSSGWSERKLSEISRYMGRGKSKHRPRNDESLYGGKYPFIQTGDVRNAKKYITKFSQTYNDKGLAQSKLWEANTVCITIAANIAEIGVLTFEACFPDSVIGVVVDEEKISVDFLYLMLLHEQQLLKSKGKGSAQDNINLATFEDMLFKVPARCEQDKIVEVLSDIQVLTDSIKSSQIKKIKSLESLKQSMLKKAFAGELVKE